MTLTFDVRSRNLGERAIKITESSQTGPPIPKRTCTRPTAARNNPRTMQKESQVYSQTGFMGRLRSRMGPYLPKISRKWPSLTFLLNCSTTIYNELALFERFEIPGQPYLCASRSRRSTSATWAAREASRPASGCPRPRSTVGSVAASSIAARGGRSGRGSRSRARSDSRRGGALWRPCAV